MSDLRRELVNNSECSKDRGTMRFRDESQQASVTLRYELHPLRCLATSTFTAKDGSINSAKSPSEIIPALPCSPRLACLSTVPVPWSPESRTESDLVRCKSDGPETLPRRRVQALSSKLEILRSASVSKTCSRRVPLAFSQFYAWRPDGRDFFALLGAMLKINPEAWPTIQQALQYPWLVPAAENISTEISNWTRVVSNTGLE
ncbi:hypothetical protein B0H14DRAFT_353395 [Mycena olivaceomarginata]|nr:hypothetical protein B0H14DRAFT_353395 [Mycena olivaceomarginata]